MALYGIRITPDDNGKPLVLDGKTRFLSYLGTPTLDGKTLSHQVKPPTAGAAPLIIPRSLIKIFDAGNPTPRVYYIKSYSLNASGVLNHVAAGSQGVESYDAPIGIVDVFSIDGGATGGGTFGTRITNGSNFLTINDTTYLGYASFRGRIDINGSWQIPGSITTMGPYVCFVRFESPGNALYLNRDNNRIEVYGPGGVISGSVAGVQIVIVSCGSVPQLPASGYGMVIRNAQGVVTFSSKYPPVMWNGAGYNFAAYEDFGSGDGERLEWTNPTGLVSQPMIPLASIGSQSGAKTRFDGTWNYRPLFYSGFKMTGNAVSSARGKTSGSEAAITLSPKAMQVACFMPCIDATDYF